MEQSPVLSLVSMMDVQSGNVVSKMLLKNRSGSVSLFAFGQGEGLSEHTAPYEALLVVIDGVATVTVDEASHRVEAGEAIRLPASIPHSVDPLTDMHMLLIMLRD